MGKKLLTDRTGLSEEPFYTPHNILIIRDFEDPEPGRKIADFLSQSAIPYENTQCLTLQCWAKRHGLPCPVT